MIITFTRSIAVGLVVLGLAAGGCTRAPTDEAPSAKAPDPQAASRELAGELLGALKLVRQEYTNAVAPGGATIVDATEYAETELFAEQAEQKLAAWRAAGGFTDAGRADELAGHLGTLRAAIGRKAPHPEVAGAAAAAIGIVQQAMAGAMPESIRGAVLASTRADQNLRNGSSQASSSSNGSGFRR